MVTMQKYTENELNKNHMLLFRVLIPQHTEYMLIIIRPYIAHLRQ